jgi:phosphatidylserine/phosphatidylglycerophosphate/cardiolipin synthase-like enzyme
MNEEEKTGMKFYFSRHKKWDFYNLLSEFISEQVERLWVVTPFIDGLGFKLLGQRVASDFKVLTRLDDNPRGTVEELREKGLLKLNEDIHTKLYIGDSSCLLGSANLTYYSLVDNLECLMELEPTPAELTEYFQRLWEE